MSQNKNLIDALQADDELSAVIRAHLYVEVQLNRLIDALLPYSKELSDSRLSWPLQINLALSLGLKNQYRPPLKKVGNIRNRFAHNPDSTIEDRDIKALFDSLHSEDKQIVLEAYKRTQGQIEDPLEMNFHELGARDRFTLIVVALHGALQAAVREVIGDEST